MANFLTAAKASERNERKSGEEREAKMKLKLMTLMNFTATQLRTANRVLYAAASDLAQKNKSKTKSTVKRNKKLHDYWCTIGVQSQQQQVQQY